MVVDDSSSSPSFRELDDVFLQSQARIWLAEVLHTRFDEQISICDLLSDGELLFEVSKQLWNMLLVKYMELKNIKARMFIPVDTRKSSGRYRPYSNVDSFLKVCKVMGLSGVDLFSPSDVVEKRDTRKVCICIRSISKKARSKQLDVPDFDIVTKTVAMSTEAIRCIRRSLESFTSSDTHGRSKHGRLKFRQKNSVVSHQQEDELSCLEESDEAKSSFSDTPYADFLYLDSGDSPDIIDRYTPTHDEFDFDFDFDFDANSEPDDHTTSIPSTLDGKVSVSCNLEPRFEEATVRNLEFSARAFSPCWDDAKSDCSVDRDIEAGNQICGTHEDSGDSLVLMKDDITNVAESIQEIGDDDNAKKEDNQLWTKGNIGVHFYSEDETKADSKDEGKDDGINCLSEANEKKIVNTEKKSTYIAPLLKTVAKGTAVIGILFLLHLRIRSDGNTNNKSNIVGFSRRKGEKGNKIYPVDKFKFGD
ncbi:uncharacterized protein LOC111897602 [Lactuca sativa]|uniref:Calponin-homology (CH) domain-containing protein n=1 Tax=Lactuca sativa TaxID=4236 RepID=A0A9R1VHQ7_LACSA|nr:uncharacterized protein LOC111897602 [Lactuca sativa]KAJ0205248.1 hypothetical protein LSAT_V11C500253960 [Lactuca sativa]